MIEDNNEEQNVAVSLEQQNLREENLEISKALEQSEPKNRDAKSILVVIVVILGFFAFTLGGFKLYDHFSGAAVVDLDQLHKDNLEGKLSENEGYIYNGFSLVKADGLWWTEVMRKDNLVKVPLHYSPRELENITIFGNLTSNFNQNEVYIAVNPTVNYNKYYTLSLMEMNNNIVQGIGREIVSACTEEDEVCENRTIVNCDNTQGKAVIELVVANETYVQFNGTCIKISGSGENLTRATDRMLYHWYRVMN